MSFLTSAEYQAKFTGKTANADFVKSLYGKLRGRKGADARVTGWVKALNAGTSRANVVRSFRNSKEASLRALDGFHAAFLRREVDPTGAAHFGRRLQRAGAT